jgi:single-strand DNA-binding protein
MPGFNRVTLLGNLTRDPQSRTLPSNTVVCDFSMAMNRRYRTQTGEDREEVCFVDCAAFGRQAEVIQQYCTKGKQLLIEGRLKYDTWDDKNGAGKRSKLSVVVENFQFLGSASPSPDTDRETGADHAAADSADRQPASGVRSAPPRSRPVRQMALDEGASFKEADIPF